MDQLFRVADVRGSSYQGFVFSKPRVRGGSCRYGSHARAALRSVHNRTAMLIAAAHAHSAWLFMVQH